MVLMGMSVATGSLSAIADKSKKPTSPSTAAPGTQAGSATSTEQAVGPDPSVATTSGQASAAVPSPPQSDKPRLFHLIGSWNFDFQKVVLSVPKAQMVFWTGIILVLFLFKSWWSGELWEVPWELVTLTGVSQAGYVGDKALERRRES